MHGHVSMVIKIETLKFYCLNECRKHIERVILILLWQILLNINENGKWYFNLYSFNMLKR